jgi:transposase
MGRRAIARSLGVTRHTVRRVLARHAAAREEPHSAVAPKLTRAPRETKVTPYASRITELLERYRDITAQRVFEILRDEDQYDGGYTAIKDHVRKVRPAKLIEPSLATPTYGPGEMAESDWTPCTATFTHAPRTTVQIFGYTLTHSCRKYYGVYEHADLFGLMDGHVRAFERFGGVAATCKYDNQKPVVLHWEGNQPVYNPRYLAFAAHYEFRPHACHRQSPNEKPRVERSFWEFERSFLNGRSFRDVEDLRVQLVHWLTSICDARKHKIRKRVVIEMFAEEAPLLRPLPRHAYDTARVVYRVCSIDGFVCWDGNRYAVPFDFLYDLLPVRITQRELFVYAPDLRVIARHELAPRSAGHNLDPLQLHRPADRRTIDLDQIRASFANLGEGGADFFIGLERLGPRHCPYHARQILLLRERYCTDDLVAALNHARTFGAFEHLAIARILQARAAPRSLAEYVAEDTATRIEQLLGRVDTRSRDLDEYDRLPLAAGPHAKEKTCPDNPPLLDPHHGLSKPQNPSPSVSPTPSPPTRPSNESDDTPKCSD